MFSGPVTSGHLLKADVSVLSNEDCSSLINYEISQLKQGIDWRSHVCTTMKTDNGQFCLVRIARTRTIHTC